MKLACIICVCIVLGASIGWACKRVYLNAQALRCSVEGIGTDQAIVDCYVSRGLPYPEGV
jgi:hypothetical protein